jgi:hypothetical protein
MSRTARLRVLSGCAAVALLAFASHANAVVCTIPAPGDLPPNCDDGGGYLSPDDVHHIIDGLPAGTEILIGAEHKEFFNIARAPGGNLGGEVENFQSTLFLEMTGTGALNGFNRTLVIPTTDQTHIGPRNPSDAVQDFDTEMFSLQGQIFGDPDFSTLSIQAGAAFGLPSPGHTTLTRLPGGDFNVDSFFDIEYRIDFQGAPGSALEGFSGSTEGTIRMQAGQPYVPEPTTLCLFGLGVIGMFGMGRRSR